MRSLCIYVPNALNVESIGRHFEATLGFQRLDAQSFESDFAIGRQANGSYVQLFLPQDPELYVEDAMGWDWIDESTRSELPGKRVITIEFNDFDLARKVLSDVIAMTSELETVVIDNDFGVLLKGSDVRSCLQSDPNWRWDRESFPEIEGCPHAE